MRSGMLGLKVWRILLPERRQWAELGTVIVLTMLMALLEAAAPAALGPFIALVQSPETFAASRSGHFVLGLTGHPATSDLVLIGGGIVVGLFAAKTLVTLLQGYVSFRYSQDFFTSLSERLLRGYLHMPWEFHVGANSAVLIRHVTTETRLIVDNVVLQSIIILSEGLVLVLLLATLLMVDFSAALAVIGFAGLALVGLRWVGRRVGNHYGHVRDRALDDLSKLSQSALNGLREIRIAGGTDFMLDRFTRAAHIYSGANTITGFLQVVPRVVLEAAAIIVILFAMIGSVARGEGSASIPTLAVFIAAGYRLLPSVNRIYVAGLMFHYVLPTLRTLAPSLQLAIDRSAEKSAAGPDLPSPRFASLRAEGLGYQYPGAERPVLSGLTLKLEAGQRIGLIGASGEGKSTLIGLLLGLLPPSEGAVLLNDRPVAGEADIRVLHACVAYVAQAVFIADDTLLANIVLGNRPDQAHPERLAEALRIAQLEELVAELPQGLDTPIGERGARLSGGQVQRVGIARALYLNRPVLVLDEATSALDPDTENRFMAALNGHRAEMAVIAISHRPAALAQCDHVYRLENGRVAHLPAPSDPPFPRAT